MSDRRWVSVSRRAALGVLCVGQLFLGGCEFVYNFGEYKEQLGVDGGGVDGGGSSGSSSAASSGSTGGGGAAPCEPSEPDCGLELFASAKSPIVYGAIALTPSFVFWINDGGIGKLSNKAPGGEVDITLGGFGVTLLAGVEDAVVYYALNSDVNAFLSDGQLPQIEAATEPFSLAMNGTYVFWPSMKDGAIHKGRYINGAPEHMAYANTLGVNPSQIAASSDMDDVYWTYQGNGGALEGGVRKFKMLDDYIEKQTRPSGIAANADAVYWMTSNGAVHRKDKNLGEVKDATAGVLGNASLTKGRVVLTDKHVYWTGPDMKTCTVPGMCDCGVDCGAIWVAPKDDLTQGVKFAQGNWIFSDLATDGIHVYWTASTPSGDPVLYRKLVL